MNIEDLISFDEMSPDLVEEAKLLTPQKMKAIRKKLCMSQQVFAEVICGGLIERTTVAHYEGGGFNLSHRRKMLILFCLKYRLPKIEFKQMWSHENVTLATLTGRELSDSIQIVPELICKS